MQTLEPVGSSRPSSYSISIPNNALVSDSSTKREGRQLQNKHVRNQVFSYLKTFSPFNIIVKHFSFYHFKLKKRIAFGNKFVFVKGRFPSNVMFKYCMSSYSQNEIHVWKCNLGDYYCMDDKVNTRGRLSQFALSEGKLYAYRLTRGGR